MNNQITITAAGAAEPVWVVRDRVTFLGDMPGTDLVVIEVEVPPGSGTPPHRHPSAEAFRILAGEVTFGVFDEAEPRFVKAGEGAFVSVPSGAAHNYHNASGATARMLVLVEHSMERFFRALGQPAAPAPGTPTPDEIGAVMAACARHGIEVLAGPRPGNAPQQS